MVGIKLGLVGLSYKNYVIESLKADISEWKAAFRESQKTLMSVLERTRAMTPEDEPWGQFVMDAVEEEPRPDIS